MKVLLIQSYLGGNEPPVFPLGLACLRSALPNHDVTILDLNAVDRPWEHLSALATTLQPDVVGLSLRNIDSTNKRRVVFYYPYLKDAIDSLRAVSRAPIIVGGSGFSMFAERIMEDEPRIDYGVYLEGEPVIRDLLDHLDDPGAVPSVFYRKDGRVVFSGNATPSDMNAIPLPDRRVAGAEDYARNRDAFGVETKRGCALNCVYCIYGFLNGKQYRRREPTRVVDDVEQLVTQSGAKRLTFVDSVFNVPRDHAEQICGEMIRRGVSAKWSAWFSEAELTRELLDLAMRAGCDHVILSPDAITDPVLRKLGKSMTRQDILTAHALLKATPGIEVSYNFFKNPPGQSLGSFLALLLFCVRAKLAMGRRIHFEFSSLRIEPHTRLHDIAVKEGLVGPDEDLLYPRNYTQRKTRYIEALFDAVLRLRGK